MNGFFQIPTTIKIILALAGIAAAISGGVLVNQALVIIGALILVVPYGIHVVNCVATSKSISLKLINGILGST